MVQQNSRTQVDIDPLGSDMIPLFVHDRRGLGDDLLPADLGGIIERIQQRICNVGRLPYYIDGWDQQYQKQELSKHVTKLWSGKGFSNIPEHAIVQIFKSATDEAALAEVKQKAAVFPLPLNK
jgi:hypothetical protein